MERRDSKRSIFKALFTDPLAKGNPPREYVRISTPEWMAIHGFNMMAALHLPHDDVDQNRFMRGASCETAETSGSDSADSDEGSASEGEVDVAGLNLPANDEELEEEEDDGEEAEAEEADAMEADIIELAEIEDDEKGRIGAGADGPEHYDHHPVYHDIMAETLEHIMDDIDMDHLSNLLAFNDITSVSSGGNTLTYYPSTITEAPDGAPNDCGGSCLDDDDETESCESEFD